jgi:hypothetical protein
VRRSSPGKTGADVGGVAGVSSNASGRSPGAGGHPINLPISDDNGESQPAGVRIWPTGMIVSDEALLQNPGGASNVG